MVYVYFPEFLGKSMTLSSILIKNSSSSGNYTWWDTVFWKLIGHVFLLRYLDERCKFVTISNWPKQGFLRNFSNFAFPRLQKSENEFKKYPNHYNRCKNLIRNPNLTSELDYHVMINRGIAKTCRISRENSKKPRKSAYNLIRKIHGILKVLQAQNTWNLLSSLKIWPN